jgi:uncharacterized membrane protein YheB (UPF0754 family)
LLTYLLQTGLYEFYKGSWVLPVAGCIVGYFTNRMALKQLFEPAKPWRFCGYTAQGLFLKRQHEASIEFAHITRLVFSDQVELWGEVFQGVWQDRWRALLDEVTEQFVHKLIETSVQRRIAAVVLLGEERLCCILTQVSVFESRRRKAGGSSICVRS